MIQLPARKNVPSTSIYTKLYVKSKLGERDILLMVPGGPGNDHTTYDSSFNSIAKALFSDVDIILFDPRGCGSSKRSAVHYCTLEHYIDDIESIRKHFNIPQDKFILFGQSYGSIAAFGYAIKYHQQLKKLILIGGAASGDFFQQAQENLLKRGTSAQQKLSEKIWTGTFNGSAAEVSEFYEIMGSLYSYTFKPGMSADVALTYNVDVLNLGFSQFLKTFNYRDHLFQVSCQTLILWGKEDWICDIQQAEIIHKGIRNSELIIFERCSHLVWIDQWEKFLNETTTFLRK